MENSNEEMIEGQGLMKDSSTKDNSDYHVIRHAPASAKAVEYLKDVEGTSHPLNTFYVNGQKPNLENGTRAKSVQMIPFSPTFSLEDRNHDAIELDHDLGGDITSGAIGPYATSLGSNASAQGENSLASGNFIIAKGAVSHAEGENSVSLGNCSHAEGYSTIAFGEGSHAEGYKTKATGSYSHAEGNQASATNGWSHAEGLLAQASGEASHAEGDQTVASGYCSHAEGKKTKATSNFQHVCGYYNEENSDALFIVGNGYEEQNGDESVEHQQNAFTVLKDGSAIVQKKLTVGKSFLYSNIDSGTTNVSRPVWFASADSSSKVTKGTPVVSDDFTYNPYNKTLTVANLEGTASKVSVSTSESTLYLLGATGTSSNQQCQVNSNVYATKGAMNALSYNASSDLRLKENISDYSCPNSILDLPVKKFDFIDGPKNQIGCIAQDLQEICPEIVHENSEGYLSIQESKIVYLLLDEVKKLRKEVDELKGGK